MHPHPHPPEDPSIPSRGSAAPSFPCPESQTHLCHGGRWALQDGLRQELLCDVTGRRGGQGSLGKGEGSCCQMPLLGRYRKGRVLSLSQLGPLASRRPFCPRVDGLLLEGICSPGKVGSQVAALAGHGVSSDTRLVKCTGGTRARCLPSRCALQSRCHRPELGISTPPCLASFSRLRSWRIWSLFSQINTFLAVLSSRKTTPWPSCSTLMQMDRPLHLSTR